MCSLDYLITLSGEHRWYPRGMNWNLQFMLVWLCVEFVDKVLPCHSNTIGSISVIPLAIGRASAIKCGNYSSFLLTVCSSLFSYFSVFVSLDC